MKTLVLVASLVVALFVANAAFAFEWPSEPRPITTVEESEAAGIS